MRYDLGLLQIIAAQDANKRYRPMNNVPAKLVP